MDGLIVKKRWLNLILSGKKTIEIRGSNTKKIGQPIYLLESGTNLVKGTNHKNHSKANQILYG